MIFADCICKPPRVLKCFTCSFAFFSSNPSFSKCKLMNIAIVALQIKFILHLPDALNNESGNKGELFNELNAKIKKSTNLKPIMLFAIWLRWRCRNLLATIVARCKFT